MCWVTKVPSTVKSFNVTQMRPAYEPLRVHNSYETRTGKGGRSSRMEILPMTVVLSQLWSTTSRVKNSSLPDRINGVITWSQTGSLGFSRAWGGGGEERKRVVREKNKIK